ncbi:MAG TPA: branched-chain amino acid ABC transporter substrate-binding protein [Herbaspirillum sp.]|uniref:branched-chain amino acid ABC transporter substrate-binding protein n=1 Tax=Herbaspirillum sp. TaxID=1890675 RepID=UPI002D48B31D|nr:branched-chain amino acid ABC transporter substrate-binding protein [Herbaspirillum sp.]HZG21641.1 branched-chain amino acid ABC transporter substrate-binding protein [Herbaspirillum sp.]
MRRPYRRSILAISLLLYVLAAPAGSENLTTITLGFTGRLSEPITQSALQGAQVAIDDANAMAVRRRSPLRFTLLPQDDHGNENFAVNIARYYIKENVAGVIGPWSSDAALATATIYESAHIPQIGFTATSSQWTGMGHRMPFRVVGGTRELAAALAEVASRSLGGRRVFVIQNDSAYSNALADALLEKLAATSSGIALGRIQVARRTTDFHNAVQAAMQHEADVIVFLALYPQARAFIEAARRSGSKARILLTGGASNLPLPPQAEPRLHVLEYEIARDHCPQWKKVALAYRNKFGTAPTTYSFHAYDAASILSAAILQTGSAEGPRIAATLHQMRYAGLHGPISFAPDGSNAHPRYTLFRHDGRWQPVEFFPAGSGRHEPCV